MLPKGARSDGVKFTKETASANARKSVQKRRERKQMREELLLMLSDGSTQKSVLEALIRQAQKGNTKAFELIRDTIGEKPIENINVTQADYSLLDKIAKEITHG